MSFDVINHPRPMMRTTTEPELDIDWDGVGHRPFRCPCGGDCSFGVAPRDPDACSICGDLDPCIHDGPEPDYAEAYGTDFESTFADLFSEAFGILCDRQAKYGPENITRQGLYGVIKRITDDKAQRLLRAVNGTIHNGTAIVDIDPGTDEDTFEDGLIDMACYSLIALALYRGLWGRELTATGGRLELSRG